MKTGSTKQIVVLVTTILFLGMIALPGWNNNTSVALAQDGGDQAAATETAATEPATPTPTDTTVPPTDTPTPTATDTPVPPGTDTPVPPVTDTPTLVPTPTSTLVVSPPTGPVPVPEPVTVVLFGTGLAALSAAVAARRKKGKE